MTGPVGVTCRRTLSRARGLFSTAVAFGGFFASVAALFALRLADAEGGPLSVVEWWTLSAAQVLPLFVSFLGMDIWGEERRSGRLDVLLATAVRERDLVLGKFGGLVLMMAFALAFSLLTTVALLWVFAPSSLAGIGALCFVPALAGLLLQGVLWCAVVSAASALFSHAAAAASVSALVTFFLPRACWAGLMAWSDAGRVAFGSMPLDAHVLDMAGGTVSTGAFGGFLSATALMLFVAAKGVALARLVGRGAGGLRLSTAVASVLALMVLAVSAPLFARLDVVLDIPVAGVSASLSPRTRSILSESFGDVAVTCLLSRRDARFRSIGRLLRLLKRESEAVGGARFTLQYVDPHWDLGAAERLHSRGMVVDGLVFECGRRVISLPLEDGVGERACATAIRRLATVPRRQTVYWTVGHGECRFDEYGPFGMSDIARDLSRDGYLNRPLDLGPAARIPGDCALIVIAGAREAFSHAELGRLDDYLKEGGRLLLLLGRDRDGGVSDMLSSWGVRAQTPDLSGLATMSGSDVIVPDFAEHAISSQLKGSRIILERPLAFAPSAAAETPAGADRLDFLPIAGASGLSFAALVERGSGVGQDLAIRPTRIVVVGDAGFVLNGSLAARANANRDFFLNCASYLSGATVAGAAEGGGDVLETGMDRRKRFRHMIGSVLVMPGIVFLLMCAEVIRRRRRS